MKRFLILAVLLSANLVCSSIPAAASLPEDTWPRIAPAAESFTVLMPRNASEHIRRVALPQQQSTATHVYYSVAKGKRYLVASFAKTSPERLIALSSFDNFVASIEEALKDEAKPLTFERDVSTAGNPIRQYHLALGRFAGVVRLVGTDKSFYAVMVIGGDTASPDVEQFLSSFTTGAANTESSNVIVNRHLDKSVGEEWNGELPPELWPLPMAKE